MHQCGQQHQYLSVSEQDFIILGQEYLNQSWSSSTSQEKAITDQRVILIVYKFV